MGIGLIFFGVVILLGFFVLVFVIGGYNTLVTLRNRYKNAYSQIDVQLKRRYDLIPNLVETAKGYLQHERGTIVRLAHSPRPARFRQKRKTRTHADAHRVGGLARCMDAHLWSRRRGAHREFVWLPDHRRNCRAPSWPRRPHRFAGDDDRCRRQQRMGTIAALATEQT